MSPVGVSVLPIRSSAEKNLASPVEVSVLPIQNSTVEFPRSSENLDNDRYQQAKKLMPSHITVDSDDFGDDDSVNCTYVDCLDGRECGDEGVGDGDAGCGIVVDNASCECCVAESDDVFEGVARLDVDVGDCCINRHGEVCDVVLPFAHLVDHGNITVRRVRR